MNPTGVDELSRIRAAYARRQLVYPAFEPWVLAIRQERERALARWIREELGGEVRGRRLVELGCGTGTNLLDFLRLGFDPAGLCGVDLIEERIVEARSRLPATIRLLAGDATVLPAEPAGFDVVFQSMMCSSILDDAMLARVVDHMLRLVRPGGGVLWYDFCYDNPRNPDVRGMPVRRVRQLFADCRIRVRRLTLAPPLCRMAVRIHPALYSWLNALPVLRTHALCWLTRRS
jgi:SAM-dependent methyltransferase